MGEQEEFKPTIEEAQQRLLQNPFFATDSDLNLVRPEVVLKLSQYRDRVMLHTTDPSRLKSIETRFPGVHYVAKELSYFVPSETVPSLLKYLRARKISFAVHERAGRALATGAELRRRAELKTATLGEEELRLALLSPYLVLRQISGQAMLVLRAYSEEQQNVLQQTIGPRCKFLLRGMTVPEAADFLFAVAQTGLRLWLSDEVLQVLKAWAEEHDLSAAHLPQGLCLNRNVEAMWVRALGEKTGLVVCRQIAPTLLEDSQCLAKIARKEIKVLTLRRHLLDDLELLVAETPQALHEAHGMLLRMGYSEVSESKEYTEFFSRCQKRKEIAERSSHFAQLRETTVNELDQELQARLFPHQRVAVSWLLQTEQAFLGDDMGLGKTLSVLATYRVLHQQANVDLLLVVCPASLVKNWQREAKEWTPETKMLSLPESKRKRGVFLKKLRSYGPDWARGLVLNFETLRLPDVCEALAEICQVRKVLLCVDESQRAKNARSKTFAALLKVAQSSSRRVLLSGTPTPKDITDIWAQMRILDDGERLGKNFFPWLEQVAELGTKYSDFAVKRFRPEPVQQTIAAVQELLLRRRKEDVISLPEKLFSVRDVLLTGDQHARYEQVRKELLTLVSRSNGQTYLRQIDSILEEFLRAVQIASNPRLVDETWKGEPAKFLELDRILEELVGEQGRKCVVWTNYRRNIIELVERYKSFGVDGFSGETSMKRRASLIERFQDSKSNLRVLIAIPAAGGVGITLTAAQTAIYLEKTWNAEHWMQSVDRLHRIGQTGTVNIISLHACLVDDIIYRNLRLKQQRQAQLLGDGEEVSLPKRQELLASVKPVSKSEK